MFIKVEEKSNKKRILFYFLKKNQGKPSKAINAPGIKKNDH